MLKITAKGLVRSMMGLVLGLSIAASAFAADGNRMLNRLQSKLNLTQAQVTQLQPVFDNFRQQQQAQRQQMQAKFNSILTPEQQAQLAQAKADNDGKGQHHGMFKNLNLTDDQKAQMKAYWQQNGPQFKSQREQFNSQVMAVLTPDQQTQFKEMMEHRHHHRHHDRDQNNQ